MTLLDSDLTKTIAAPKKETDRTDASRVPADLLHGEYVAGRYVPDKKTLEQRQLVQYRERLIRQRTAAENSVHGILLQRGIEIPGITFTKTYCKKLRALNDYRIDGFLEQIDHLNGQITETDDKVRVAARANSDAMLIRSIPGIDDYSALAIASEIGDIGRFSDSHKLCAYARVIPSVRNSPDTMTLRRVLTECAHAHAIHAKDSDITKFYNRLKKKRGTSRAAVATASKMLRVIFWMLKDRREFVKNYG